MSDGNSSISMPRTIDVEARKGSCVRHPRVPSHARAEEPLCNQLKLQLARFAIGNDQEIARATGWIQKGQTGQAVVEALQRFVAARAERSRPLEF